MSRIRIKNFGPIRDGFDKNGGFIDLRKVTVFIGDQGAGKSTVTKLISTLTWLEKSLIREDITEKELTSYKRFKDKHCAYQKIDSYFKDNTEIEYQGNAYSFTYNNGNLTVNKNDSKTYLVPKIMYVPAERNFVSAVDQPTLLKRLPNTLYTFLDEFENAKRSLKDGLPLPINNTRFEYQKLNSLSWLVGKDYKIRLSEASSGFQSLVPLFLVTRYLTLGITQESSSSVKEQSVEVEKRIRREIEKILSNENLSDEIKQASLEVLSSRFRNSCFVNIVEEPEQNLYPSSQKELLFKLFEYNNSIKNNQLVITTHSPYIISYLTLAIKAQEVFVKIKHTNQAESLKNKLEKVIKETNAVAATDAIVYELKNGEIIELKTYNGLPSDDNYLNQLLADTNTLFDKILEVEELCQ